MVKNITFFKIINLHTDFIPRHFDELFPKRETSNELICAATMAVILNEKPQFIDGMALNASYRLVKKNIFQFLKGQLISKCPYEKLVWTKCQRKYF